MVGRPLIKLLALLVAASAMCVAIYAARVWFADTWHYGFLVWNLVLAWVPLAFAAVACAAAAPRRLLGWLVFAVSAVAWLVFFPNAPYILTDFQHLAWSGGDVPVWYDVMVVVWFAWTGLLLGVVSLYLMQSLVERALGTRAGWWFVLGVTCLAAVGIYIGRFLRWNSWQVVSDPYVMADPMLVRLRDPAGNARLIAFTLLYALFFLFVYALLRLFAELVRAVEERDPAATPSSAGAPRAG